MIAPASNLKNNQRLSKGRGGARNGAGRKAGIPNKATGEIRDLAKQYTAKALRALVDVLEDSDSDPARVSAANAILDRGWGRPSQTVEHGGLGGGPIKHIVQVSDEDLLAIATGKR